MKTRIYRWRRTCYASVFLLVATVLVGGCGSSGSSTSPSTMASGSKEGDVAKAEQGRLLKGIGYKSPPVTSVSPSNGKRVWVFSCDQAVSSCSTPTSAAIAAAKTLGWSTTLYDVKFDPSRLAEGFRQAIAAKAEGVILYSLDCPLAKGAVAAARAAGVKIVAAESLNCDPAANGYSHVVSYTQGSFPEWEHALGESQATNLIAGTGGAKVIAINQTDLPALRPVVAGLKQRMAQCGAACEIVDWVTYTASDVGTSLQQKIQQAIVQHPEANAMWLPYDMFSLGPDAALRASGSRGQDMLVSLGEGQASTLDVLRSGRVNGVGVGIPQAWEGYASVDALNRLFAGQTPLPSGIGLQAYNEHRNIPSSGPWQPPIDYRSAYLKAWGRP